MPRQPLEFLTQQAMRIESRRGAVGALGAATLAFVARPQSAEARRKKSCKKKIRRKIKRTCSPQIQECEAAYEAIELPEFIPCCAHLATCNFTEFFACAT